MYINISQNHYKTDLKQKRDSKKLIFSPALFQEEWALPQYQDANQDCQGPIILHSSLPFIKIHGTRPQTLLYPLQLI